MEYIRLNKANLKDENICCLAANKTIVAYKKQWLFKEFNDGLIFLKREGNEKCFIEYIPAENAWIPIVAKGYIFINCLWIADTLKGQGYSNDLVNMCITESKKKNKSGICILSSPEKKKFFVDSEYLKYKGFKIADISDCGVQLWYLPLKNNVTIPKFTHAARHPYNNDADYVLYYTDQCPYTAKYVQQIIKVLNNKNTSLKVIHITNKIVAKKAPTPTTTFTLFKDGNYLTHDIFYALKILKII